MYTMYDEYDYQEIMDGIRKVEEIREANRNDSQEIIAIQQYWEEIDDSKIFD